MIDEVWDAYFGWGLAFHDAASIIDIGANIGAFTVEASRRALRGRVIAFEPEPENFYLLQQNVEAQSAGNVILRQEAVSDHAGTARLALDTEHTGAHTIIGTKDGGLSVEVPLVPFSDVLADIGSPVDVLKIDCEGAEYDVLLGAPGLVQQRVRQIVGEIQHTDRHLPKDLTDFLASLGFIVEYRGSKNLGLVKATNPTLRS
jgi:FkbM family methyltransferase